MSLLLPLLLPIIALLYISANRLSAMQSSTLRVGKYESLNDLLLVVVARTEKKAERARSAQQLSKTVFFQI